jgi:polyisoprenoid-binding protein YceI
MFQNRALPSFKLPTAGAPDRSVSLEASSSQHASAPAARRIRQLAPLALGVGLLLAGSMAGALTATAAPVAQADDGMIHLSLVPGASEARYRIMIKRIGAPLSEEICGTRAVGGEIVLNPDGGVVAEKSKIVVDQRTIQCEQPSRTASVQNTMQTSQYPTAEFVVRDAPGLSQPLAPGPASFAFNGDLTVHGVTQPASWTTNGTFADGQFTGLSSTPMKMTTYGMKPPHIPLVLDVQDDLTIEVNLVTAVIQPSAAPAAPADTPADPAS